MAQVSGTVFRDFNANGQKDNSTAYNEVGVQGIVVTGYPQTGSPVSATTNASGAYSLAGLSGAVRVEFSSFSPGDYSGPQGTGNATSTQFVTAPATNINFGINAPDDYWDNTNQPVPSLVLPCYINGSQTQGPGATMDAIVQIGNDQNGLTPAHQTVAQAQQVGAVWGTAFQKKQKRFFFASFVKRHVAFGPKGIGGVYIADASGSTYGITGSFSLQGVTPANGGAALDLGSVDRSSTNPTADNFVESTTGTPNRDLNAFVKVGTAGFGDIDIDEARQTLYMVNMNQRRLVSLDISGGTAVLNNASATTLGPLTKAYDILSLPGIPTAQNGQLRPWGLKIYKGRGYLGIVADASQQTKANNPPYFPSLKAYVLSFDVTNIAAGFRTELTLDMSYRDNDKNWRGWLMTPQNGEVDGDIWSYFQPVLSDIEFDEKGGMILGFSDRWGHQTGYFNYEPISGSTNTINCSAYGDILYACYDPLAKTWSMEGAGSCPIHTTNDLNNSYSGTGEYFNDLSGDGYPENGMGALAKLMGTNHTIAVVVDPFPFGGTTGSDYWSTGGIHWFNQSTGNWDQYARIYDVGVATTFAKAHGLGDIEANLTPPPIEIGNRIWKDTDNDGVQDAGEPPLAGVTVSLFLNCTGNAVATAITDANGNYFFSSASGTSTGSIKYNLALANNTAYCLKVTALGSDPSVSGLSLASVAPAPGETSGSTNTGATLNNNDAFVVSGQPTISLTTGDVGANNHTYDFGFIAAVCSLTATATAGTCATATNTYSATAVVQLTNPTAGTLTVTNGAQSLTFATTSAGSATYTAVFNGLLSDGASHTVTASLPGCSTTTTTYTAPVSCSVAPPCGLAMVVTPGLCTPATNTYVLSGTITATNVPTSGTLTISSGAFANRTIALPAGNATGTFSYSGLVANGQPYTVTATYSNAACSPVSATYSAPVACSVAPPCSISASATAGLCATATNTYSASVVVSLANAPAGTLTVTLPGASAPISQTIAANTTSFTAVFTGLLSDGATHTATISLPGCGTTTATYSAPASCSVAPVCSLTATTTRSLCASATNTYSSTVTVTVTNSLAGVLTVTDGAASLTLATAAATTGTYTAVFNGLTSDGAVHTVTASLPGCSTTTTTYTAPASCSVAPVCSLTATATAGLCATATNTYSATAVVRLTNPTAGVLTITNGAQSLTFATTATTSATYTAVFTGLLSDGAVHTVTASLPGCSTTTATYTAPASCSVAPACGLAVTATGTNCNPATNLYVLAGTITLTNSPTSQTLTLTDGTYVRSLTANAGNTTLTFSYTTLQSDGALHTVTVTSSATACATASTTYTAPASCSVALVCSLTAAATPGLCATATNTFSNTVLVTLTNPTAGTLTVSEGVRSVTFVVPASVGTTTATAVFNGLPSDGLVHTVTVSLPGCSTTTATYTAPVSCSSTPVCSLTATATAGLCATATNTYSATAVVRLTNPTAGVLTVTNGAQSLTFATTATTSATYTAVFNGLTSDGAVHTVTASLPGCSTTTTTYTAPTSCSVAPVCSLTATATAGLCATATNTYSATAVVRLTNPTVGVLTVTNGAQSLTFATTAVSSATYTAVFNGLTSDGATHTVTASLPGCSTTTATYTAPASCSSTPTCSLTAAATAGICASATNTYSATAVVRLTNPTAGVLTVTNGAQSLTFATTAVSLATYTAVFNGLTSDGAVHTVTASLPGCSTTTTTYTAPASCSAGPVCSLTATATAGLCATATNTYSATAVVRLTNPTAGVLTVTNGAQSLTFATTAVSSATYTAVFSGLLSDGATHTVTASLPGCSTTTATYTAPGSCTQPAGTRLTLDKLVSASKAKIGDLITYTLVLTNVGSTTATNVVVRDSTTTGLQYVANSATPPAGTTFTQGSPLSYWSIGSIAPAQSLSLTFQAIADSSGILYNVATIPGDTATVCTTVPVVVCAGEVYTFRLTVAPGRSSYQWFKDGVAITGATTNTLDVTAPGTYSLAVDNTTGKCPDFSCCPFIVEEDSLPTFQATTTPVTCIGNTAQTNGKIVLTNFKAGYTYQYSLGSTFNAAASLSGAPKVIPANGVLVSNLTNPTVDQTYTIRVYNSSGCYTDVTVTLKTTVCGCPDSTCVPLVIKQTKGPLRRQGL